VTTLTENREVEVSGNSSSAKLRIAVLGLGHVGLPTALGFAELGWEVIGADDDASKVAMIQSGKTPFYEPGLNDLLARALASGRLTLSHRVEEAVRDATILFVCVGTPQKDTGEADLRQIEAVARTIARNLNGYKLIVEKSTVPAITAQWIQKTVTRFAKLADVPSRVDAEFDVASNPEFLQEGKAIENIFHPDRVVVGVESERARALLEQLYQPLGRRILFTNISTAELTKHAANAFLSTKISFINMVADICEAVGADVSQVALGMGLDPRIGSEFLNAGIGFGGYCFPKDLRAFMHLGHEYGVECGLLREVEKINLRRVEAFVKKVRQAVWVLQGKQMGVLGLAFKGGTDDIRESPALRIVKALLEEGARLRLHDPQAMEACRREMPPQAGRLEYCSSPYEAARGAHALLILTPWQEYRELDLARVHEFMEVPVIIDGRNLLDPEVARSADFEYVDMGRNRCAQPPAAEPPLWRNQREGESQRDASHERQSISSFACGVPTVEP
jgi:UDPglucose 6-dehydrogenase